ncbi:acyl carrier protein [Spirillospora sp. CA-294931]|uniref:acyl carrier protein n=1 Tax=Spirillospora sp. CA-294931 TaxID=3240042 RepID=UPI003D8D5202
MTHEEAITMVIGLVARARHLDPSQLSAATELVGDLGFDSLDAAELLAALHNETGRRLDAASIADIRTVGEIAQRVAGDRERQEVL